MSQYQEQGPSDYTPNYGGYYSQDSGSGYGTSGYGAGGATDYQYSQPSQQLASYQSGNQQSYGYYQQRLEHPQASTVFTMGILGIFVPIVSFIAWYMGSSAKKEIDAGAPYAWEGNLKTGYLLGMIFSIIGIISIALFVLYIIFMMVLFAGALSTVR